MRTHPLIALAVVAGGHHHRHRVRPVGAGAAAAAGQEAAPCGRGARCACRQPGVDGGAGVAGRVARRSRRARAASSARHPAPRGRPRRSSNAAATSPRPATAPAATRPPAARRTRAGVRSRRRSARCCPPTSRPTPPASRAGTPTSSTARCTKASRPTATISIRRSRTTTSRRCRAPTPTRCSPTCSRCRRSPTSPIATSCRSRSTSARWCRCGTCCTWTRRRSRPTRAHDEQWNRGAYLVEGPGHCAACHTPKTDPGRPAEGPRLPGRRVRHLVRARPHAQRPHRPGRLDARRDRGLPQDRPQRARVGLRRDGPGRAGLHLACWPTTTCRPSPPTSADRVAVACCLDDAARHRADEGRRGDLRRRVLGLPPDARARARRSRSRRWRARPTCSRPTRPPRCT